MNAVESRRNEWQGLLDSQVESGLSAAAFCRERKVDLNNFYAWRKRLQLSTEFPSFIELKAPDAVREKPFVELRIGRHFALQLWC